MKLKDHLNEAEQRLRSAGVDDPRRDARLLLADALNCEPSRLILLQDEAVSPVDVSRFSERIDARCQRQPVSQIIGYREFWGRRFKVTQDVLDPRPDTECLIEEALNGKAPKRFLDICTGSGNIATTLLCEWPETSCVATDISHPALNIAHENAMTYGVADRLDLQKTSWLSKVGAGYDLVVSNPPYISAWEMQDLAPEVQNWEPHIALSPGEDGLEPYRKFAEGLEQILAPSGRAIFEIGYMQAEAVTSIFVKNGYRNPRIIHDLGGNARIIAIAHKN